MDIVRVKTMYFSPTGTSKKIVTALAAGMSGDVFEEIDITYPNFSHGTPSEVGDVTIIGVPVYAGRVPALALERLQGLKGRGTPAVVAVIFGNREYEDALIELRNTMIEKGFQVVACCAFIGEHSFSTEELPIAEGRPDGEDIELAKQFSKQIGESIGSLGNDKMDKITVPGNHPYQDGMKNLPFGPVVDKDGCTLCEVCISTCPAGAISLEDVITMNVDLCILCCACIKNCPEDVVSLSAPPLKEKMVWLNENCKQRKEPLLFL